jgi:hypothetical protein
MTIITLKREELWWNASIDGPQNSVFDAWGASAQEPWKAIGNVLSLYCTHLGGVVSIQLDSKAAEEEGV